MGDHWYVARGKQKLGPFSFEELKERARTGGVLPVEMVLQEGTDRWRSAGEVEGLCWRAGDDVAHAVPPPASPPTAAPPGRAPTGPEEVLEGIPLPPAPT